MAGSRYRRGDDCALPGGNCQGGNDSVERATGRFEIPEFGEGTIAIAEALAQSGATTIIGGGDSVTAVKQAGLAGKDDVHFHRRWRDAGIARRQRAAGRGRAQRQNLSRINRMGFPEIIL
jgi:3-phosphoglycerate kinase